MDGHRNSHRDRNGHAHPAADGYANGHENPNHDAQPLANGHKRPNYDTHSLADGHKPPNGDGYRYTTHFANSYKRPNNALSSFADGHKHPSNTLPPSTNGHRSPQTDEHTGLDTGSDKDRHCDPFAYTVRRYDFDERSGRKRSDAHCRGLRLRRARDTLPSSRRVAQDTVANRPPDSCGHSPATDGNRNPGCCPSGIADLP